MTDVFQALAHPARRAVLRLLKTGGRSAGAIAERLDIAKPTLSGHLNALKSAGLVDVERRGSVLIYRINATVAEEALGMAMDLLRVGDERERRTSATTRKRTGVR